MTGHKVYLELWVKVRPKWRQSEEAVRRLGLKEWMACGNARSGETLRFRNDPETFGHGGGRRSILCFQGNTGCFGFPLPGACEGKCASADRSNRSFSVLPDLYVHGTDLPEVDRRQGGFLGNKENSFGSQKAFGWLFLVSELLRC